MPYKLKNLRIKRVDLVDKGANQESHIVLFKRDSEDIEKAMTLKEVLDMRERKESMHEDRYKITDAFMESLQSCCELEDKNERERIAVESAKQFVDMMKPIHDLMSEEEKEIYMSDDLKKKLEELEAENTDLKKRLEEKEAELAKRDNGDKEEDIWKGVPDPIRKQFEEQKAQTELMKAALQNERDEREKQEAIQKAASYEYLPINPDDDWEVFKAIKSLDPKVSSRIEALLKAGDTNMQKSGLEREVGTAGDVNGGGKTELDEINSLINKRMQENNRIDYAEAQRQVVSENPRLYEAYKRSVQIK